MKISIITVVYNNKKYLEDSIRSVKGQSHSDVEYIVVDGGSTDGSLEIIKKYDKSISKWISETDSGIYDAMNKGVALATGDIVGFLNSDDIYFSGDILNKVSKTIEDNNSDCCYGDLVYVSGDLTKTIRYWKAGSPGGGSFRKGWMPPHPAFFVGKKIFENFGSFRTDFKISADYELMLRFFERGNISASYIPEILVKMRIGGKSNRGLKNLIRKSLEDYKAWRVNGLKISPLIMLKKPFLKVGQFFKSGKI
ncbi:MAG: glycosyltransferase family 2 protein [Acidobacteriota bacterium]